MKLTPLLIILTAPFRPHPACPRLNNFPAQSAYLLIAAVVKSAGCEAA